MCIAMSSMEHRTRSRLAHGKASPLKVAAAIMMMEMLIHDAFVDPL